MGDSLSSTNPAIERVVITDKPLPLEKIARQSGTAIVCTSSSLATELRNHGVMAFAIEEFAPLKFDHFDQLCDHYRVQVANRFHPIGPSADEFGFQTLFSQFVSLLAPALYFEDVIKQIMAKFGGIPVEIAIDGDEHSRVIVDALVKRVR